MTRYPRLYKRSGVMAVTDVTTHAGETFEALIGNLSRGGIGLYSDQALTPGRNVQLRLTFLTEDGLSGGEVVEAAVRWCRKVRNHHAVGLEFRNVSPDTHPGLLALIERSGRGES